MGSPFFDFNRMFSGEDYSDPIGLDKFEEEERLRKEEENNNNDGLLSGLWEGAKWLFDSSPLKPVADEFRKPDSGYREAARTLIPGVAGIEGLSGAVSGLGALAGMGMNLDPTNPDKYRALPENAIDVLKEEAYQGLPTALEQVAPIDIATVGASGLASALPKGLKGVSALSKAAKALDVGEGLYGVENIGEGLYTGDYAKVGAGLARSAGGLGGLIPSKVPSIDPVSIEGPKFDPVEEMPSFDPIIEDTPSLQNLVPESLEAGPKSDLYGDPELESLMEPEPFDRNVADTRMLNMTESFVRRIKDEASRVLGNENIKDVSIEIDRSMGDTPAAFHAGKNVMYINPDILESAGPKQFSKYILHELAHSNAPHSTRTSAKLDEGIGKATLTGLSPETTAILPEDAQAHTWQNIEEVGKVSPVEHEFRTNQDILFQNPAIQEVARKLEKNIRPLMAERFRAKRGLPSLESEGRVFPLEAGPEIDPISSEDIGIPTEQIVSEPANILRKILTETKLTKFNKSTMIGELEAKGIPVPEKVKAQIPELLNELKTRGWINEKAGGTYSLLVQPPKRVTEVAKSKTIEPVSDLETSLRASIESLGSGKATKPVTPVTTTPPVITTPKKSQLTPDEISAIAKVFGTTATKKGVTSAVSEEVSLAQKAAIEGGSKKPVTTKETGAFSKTELEETMKAGKPPELEVPKEVGGEKPSKKSYLVTLSDGTSHKVKAESSEAAQAKAEEILTSFGSTKIVDKVEEALGSLEKAAKYEVEPTKQGIETVKDIEIRAKKEGVEEVKEFGEQVKGTEKLKKEQFKEKKAGEKLETKEGTKLLKEEDKLRKAQTKEKFEKKPYTVTLSNGKTVNVRGRTENSVREYVQTQIKKDKSKATIASVAPKKTSLETAIANEPDVKARARIKKGLIDDITDIPKTLKSAFDISWPGRQGLFLLNRKEARAGMLEGTKSGIPFKGDEFHSRTVKDLMNRPNAELYERFKLNQVKWDPEDVGDIASRSEEYPSEIAADLPGFKHSERMFNDAGNLARANMFDKFASDFQADGKTPDSHPELYKGMSDYLNVLTMRKPLPEKLKQAGWILNKTFFSPMAIYSRLQTVNPAFYAKLPKEMQKAALRDVGGTLATITSLLGAVKYAASMDGESDVDVSFDPAHTHFGRLKVGKTYYDLPGLTPMLRTFYRITSGRKATPKGEYKLPGGIGTQFQDNLEEAPFGTNAFNELAGFVENKTSPIYHASKGLMTGKGFYGKEYGLSSFLADLAAPMSIEQMTEAGIDYGGLEAAKQLPNFFGVSTFLEPKDSGKGSGSKKKKKRTYAFN